MCVVAFSSSGHVEPDRLWRLRNSSHLYLNAGPRFAGSNPLRVSTYLYNGWDRWGDLLFASNHSWAKLPIALLALSCAGCSIVPTSGPQSMDVRTSQAGEPGSLPYALVKLTPEVVRVLGRYTPRLSTAFADRSPPKAFRFGIGDTVSVTIFESAAGGLFIPAEASVRPGNFVTIPNQAVDDKGNIEVPYAG